jgi:hypothetical protein
MNNRQSSQMKEKTNARLSRAGLLKKAATAAAATVGAGILLTKETGTASAAATLVENASGSGNVAIEGNGTSGAWGVYGTTDSGFAVAGYASTGAGVAGISNSDGGVGVLGGATGGASSVGIQGGAPAVGIIGLADTTTTPNISSYPNGGVIGDSASNATAHGIIGTTANAGKGGVFGKATGSGLGGMFQGGSAPLYLIPSTSAGAPSAGNHYLGEIYVDVNGVFWVCVAGGTPGAWKSLSSVVPIPNVRVMNTRPSHQIGPYAGPIANDQTLSLTLAGANGIPSNATGVMGNLTAADATAGCFLALVPHGANHAGVSSVNFPALAQGSGVANSFTVGLSSDGKVDIYTGNCSSYSVNIIIDITGYIV